jgi:hypothetical protein
MDSWCRLRRGESVVSFVGYPGILLDRSIWDWSWYFHSVVMIAFE